MERKQVEELKEFLQEKIYTLIYVDFANPKNVMVSHQIDDFSFLDLEHFAKFYVFNDNFMRVYSRKGPKHFDYYEIKKEDFEAGYDEKIFLLITPNIKNYICGSEKSMVCLQCNIYILNRKRRLFMTTS